MFYVQLTWAKIVYLAIHNKSISYVMTQTHTAVMGITEKTEPWQKNIWLGQLILPLRK